MDRRTFIMAMAAAAAMGGVRRRSVAAPAGRPSPPRHFFMEACAAPTAMPRSLAVTYLPL